MDAHLPSVERGVVQTREVLEILDGHVGAALDQKQRALAPLLDVARLRDAGLDVQCQPSIEYSMHHGRFVHQWLPVFAHVAASSEAPMMPGTIVVRSNDVDGSEDLAV